MLTRLEASARSAAAQLAAVGNGVLDALERRLCDGSPRVLRHRPIFIIGAPRCGSTVFHQALVTRFELGYIANVHNLFHGAPAALESVLCTRSWPRRATFDSHYGRTRGWLAPHEAGEFWYRFFRRRPHHVRLGDVDASSLRALRGAVRALVDAFDAPIAFKNLYCSGRIEPLAHALPEALFVVLRRREFDNAHSLLQGRIELMGDAAAWFSLEPPDVDSIRHLPPAAQVVEQIRGIYRFIDEQRAIVGGSRFLDLEYESFCADPSATLGRVSSFCLDHGSPLRVRGVVPASFEMRHESRIPRELVAALHGYLSTR